METSLKIAENIMCMRKNRGVTQDEMASFLGVTKASVSKWENGQSMPDILLLPEIATYFDVTVDELLGYEPQLSVEQIQKLYGQLRENFVTLTFEEAFAKSEVMVKKYYACYSFLLQICILWLNHYMLAEKKERQRQILEQLQELCNHILDKCTNTEICSDVIGIKASADLLLGKPMEAIEGLSNLLNPKRILNQSDCMLIQAYLMNGEQEKADSFTQASLYLHLLMVMEESTCLLTMHMQEKEICQETIARVDALIGAYHMDQLNPNSAAGFYFQAAVYHAVCGETEEALFRLQQYVDAVGILLDTGMLHGDSYFTKLGSWLEELDLGTQMPRSKMLVIQSAKESLKQPVFDGLRGRKEFARLEKTLMKF